MQRIPRFLFLIQFSTAYTNDIAYLAPLKEVANKIKSHVYKEIMEETLTDNQKLEKKWQDWLDVRKYYLSFEDISKFLNYSVSV